MVQEYCVCGHRVDSHSSWQCHGTIEHHNNGTYYTECSCVKAQLDNLKLVEDLAKERNLIN
jgi:hypothetical protein